MNYLKIYINIIRRAEDRNLDSSIYTESHHIFPRSIWRSKSNIRTVKLTAKEHFISHLLLWKAFRKRYGVFHYRTKKMHFAANQMTWNHNGKRYNSRLFSLARMANFVYWSGDGNPSKRPEVRNKIAKAKIGKPRNDLKGKSYFGASEDKIKSGIEKMVIKKTGMKINYPKNRKSPPCSEEKRQKIKATRSKTKDNYINMSVDDFNLWISEQNLYNKNGKRNSNVTRVLSYRNIPIEEYYN